MLTFCASPVSLARFRVILYGQVEDEGLVLCFNSDLHRVFDTESSMYKATAIEKSYPSPIYSPSLVQFFVCNQFKSY